MRHILKMEELDPSSPPAGTPDEPPPPRGRCHGCLRCLRKFLHAMARAFDSCTRACGAGHMPGWLTVQGLHNKAPPPVVSPDGGS